jgi:hypothetical protein
VHASRGATRREQRSTQGCSGVGARTAPSLSHCGRALNHASRFSVATRGATHPQACMRDAPLHTPPNVTGSNLRCRVRFEPVCSPLAKRQRPASSLHLPILSCLKLAFLFLAISASPVPSATEASITHGEGALVLPFAMCPSTAAREMAVIRVLFLSRARTRARSAPVVPEAGRAVRGVRGGGDHPAPRGGVAEEPGP